MIRKTILIASLLGLFVSSCTRSNEPQLETPELSIKQESEIVLSGRNADYVVAITTNQEAVAAIPQDDWLVATIEGKTLKLRATDNPEPQDRSTKVQVVAGGLVRDLAVRQLSADKTLELGFAPERQDQWGGTVSIDIVSNTNTWEAKTAADWLRLHPHTQDGILEVEVLENKDRQERTAQVEVSLDGLTKTFEVSQDGIIYFLSPFTTFAIPSSDLIEMEAARKSQLLESPRSEYLDGYYRFKTISPIFPEISYKWIGRSQQIREALIPLVLPEGAELNEALKTEIVDFFQTASEGEPLISMGQAYFSKTLWTDFEFVKLPDGRDALQFTFIPRQNPLADHLTTKQLPFSPDFELTKTTKDEVQAWMDTLGATLDNTRSFNTLRHYVSERKFTRQDNTELVLKTHHRFTISGVSSTLSRSEHYDALYLSYGYLPDEVKTLEFFLTYEFRKLLADSGFVFVSKTSSLAATTFIYHNVARNLKLTINPYTTHAYEKAPNNRAASMKFDRIN